ncbi:NUDIX hydrolase [Legionella erythra]|uniref:MutT/nudix family transporter protein n=1 Tax=Legionella erythra TaxID=448 RepID=A0A0W0TQT2_LEGER|nr:CoA pyrophosphatase [Legionella erythra]KTC98020.1 MutT/nudix family transporter protein [Legionella erythra]
MDRKKTGHDAAVIVLVEESSQSLILTQRSPQLKNHPGEICFPGGRWQPGDLDFYRTALRELWEELGIDAGRIHSEVPLAVEKTLTGFIIHPWLAKIKALHPYRLDDQEVADVFRIPLNEVCRKTNYQPIRIEREGMVFESCRYVGESDRFVWGATARIMMQLCALDLSH